MPGVLSPPIDERLMCTGLWTGSYNDRSKFYDVEIDPGARSTLPGAELSLGTGHDRLSE